jgi:hypothetical protein
MAHRTLTREFVKLRTQARAVSQNHARVDIEVCIQYDAGYTMFCIAVKAIEATQELSLFVLSQHDDRAPLVEETDLNSARALPTRIPSW